MTKFKVGDKFVPRKPKGQEYPLMGKYWDKMFTVKSIENGWIRSVESGSRFRPDWCEKVDDPIPTVGETIDWERRRYEIAKDFMAAQINSLYLKNKGWNYDDEARYAVNAADVLIEQLQKSSQK